MPCEQFFAPWQRPQSPAYDGRCAIAIQAADKRCVEATPSTRKSLPVEQVGSQGLQDKHEKNGVPSQVDTTATGEGCTSREENLPEWEHKIKWPLDWLETQSHLFFVPVKSPLGQQILYKVYDDGLRKQCMRKRIGWMVMDICAMMMMMMMMMIMIMTMTMTATNFNVCWLIGMPVSGFPARFAMRLYVRCKLSCSFLITLFRHMSGLGNILMFPASTPWPSGLAFPQ